MNLIPHIEISKFTLVVQTSTRRFVALKKRKRSWGSDVICKDEWWTKEKLDNIVDAIITCLQVTAGEEKEVY